MHYSSCLAWLSSTKTKNVGGLVAETYNDTLHLFAAVQIYKIFDIIRIYDMLSSLNINNRGGVAGVVAVA